VIRLQLCHTGHDLNDPEQKQIALVGLVDPTLCTYITSLIDEGHPNVDILAMARDWAMLHGHTEPKNRSFYPSAKDIKHIKRRHWEKQSWDIARQQALEPRDTISTASCMLVHKATFSMSLRKGKKYTVDLLRCTCTCRVASILKKSFCKHYQLAVTVAANHNLDVEVMRQAEADSLINEERYILDAAESEITVIDDNLSTVKDGKCTCVAALRGVRCICQILAAKLGYGSKQQDDVIVDSQTMSSNNEEHAMSEDNVVSNLKIVPLDDTTKPEIKTNKVQVPLIVAKCPKHLKTMSKIRNNFTEDVIFKSSSQTLAMITYNKTEKCMSDHIRDREYKCSQCGEAFYFLESLNDHMKIHENQSAVLNIHSGEKQYKCSYCGKAFNLSKIFLHMKIHKNQSS